MKNKSNLWSDSPVERLNAARSMTETQKRALVESLSAKAPIAPWPWGMPTSVNPIVLIVGASPGVGGGRGRKCKPPTVGEAHPEFGGDFTNPAGAWDNAYWAKIRALCIQVVQNLAAELSASDALALSGHLNLSTKNLGQASRCKFNPAFVKWVADVVEN